MLATTKPLAFREANCGSTPRLEVELELAAHGRAEAVEKLAESRACDVILHIMMIFKAYVFLANVYRLDVVVTVIPGPTLQKGNYYLTAQKKRS